MFSSSFDFGGFNDTDREIAWGASLLASQAAYAFSDGSDSPRYYPEPAEETAAEIAARKQAAQAKRQERQRQAEEAKRLVQQRQAEVAKRQEQQREAKEQVKRLKQQHQVAKQRKMSEIERQHLNLISKPIHGDELTQAIKTLPRLMPKSRFPESKDGNLFQKILDDEKSDAQQKEQNFSILFNNAGYDLKYRQLLLRPELTQKALKGCLNIIVKYYKIHCENDAKYLNDNNDDAHYAYSKRNALPYDNEISIWEHILKHKPEAAEEIFNLLKDTWYIVRQLKFFALWLASKESATDVIAIHAAIKKQGLDHYNYGYIQLIESRLLELELPKLTEERQSALGGESKQSKPVKLKGNDQAKSIFKSSHSFFCCCSDTNSYKIYQMALTGKGNAQQAFVDQQDTFERDINRMNSELDGQVKFSFK